MLLKEYQKKRDFRETSEPKGKVPKTRGKAIFVIHEHHSSVMHFDLRLEIAGVLKSWSVPKGPSLDPGVRRLAVEVEDHPIEYATFNGVIPEGQYGAGASLIWDKGRVVFEQSDAEQAWSKGHLSFELEGKKLHGSFSLIRTKMTSSKPQWLLIKKSDDFAEAGWKLKLIQPDERFTEGNGTPEPVRSKSRKAKRTRVAKKDVRSPDGATSASELPDEKEIEGNSSLKIGRNRVDVSNVNKLYWPADRIRKGDLIHYYITVGETIMPHLKDRPAILKRFPNGVDKPAFFQHNVTTAPPFIKTIEVQVEKKRTVHYAVYTDLASLIYLVNLGNIDQHCWLSRVDNLDRPDYVVFDLDPKGAPFSNVLKVALSMKETLDRLKVTAFAKTSGSSGMHIFIPIKRQYTFPQVLDWAERVSNLVAGNIPRIATTERRLARRAKGQIYLDAQQNARGKSIAAPYTVRPRPKATVSAPVTWEEVEEGFVLEDFTIETMPDRINKLGDLWEDFLKHRQVLPPVE